MISPVQSQWQLGYGSMWDKLEIVARENQWESLQFHASWFVYSYVARRKKRIPLIRLIIDLLNEHLSTSIEIALI